MPYVRYVYNIIIVSCTWMRGYILFIYLFQGNRENGGQENLYDISCMNLLHIHFKL